MVKNLPAERIVYGALNRVEEKLKRAPVEAFHEAVENVKPSVEVGSRVEVQHIKFQLK